MTYRELMTDENKAKEVLGKEWIYHLSQIAMSDDPQSYLDRLLDSDNKLLKDKAKGNNE